MKIPNVEIKIHLTYIITQRNMSSPKINTFLDDLLLFVYNNKRNNTPCVCYFQNASSISSLHCVIQPLDIYDHTTIVL